MQKAGLREALVQHIEEWGLRRFTRDSEYFQWQRATLSSADLHTLHRLIKTKRAAGGEAAKEAAFYDQTAAPHILPVLYSQRYEYFLTVGLQVTLRIPPAQRVLDFGCGIGLLTTFFARQFPHIRFAGIDRSTVSVGMARQYAERFALRNVRFEAVDLEAHSAPDAYDLIIATHALLQAEQDPGLPSRSWRTLDRVPEAEAQMRFEARTGLGRRLDRVAALLVPEGRLILFEKARQLARRIPFQRALASRGFTLLQDPLPLGYSLVEEDTEDGPLYVLGRTTKRDASGRLAVWNEAPEEAEVQNLYRCTDDAAGEVWRRLPARVPVWDWRDRDPALGMVSVESGRGAVLFEYLYVTINNRPRGLLIRPWQEGATFEGGVRRALEASRHQGAGLAALIEQSWPRTRAQEPSQLAPLYENHSLAAMQVWEALGEKTIIQHETFPGTNGQEAHIELGRVRTLAYLYFANTFDQRQILIFDAGRSDILKQYYDELTAGFRAPG
jgi:SAM-dependent methyltransferase